MPETINELILRLKNLRVQEDKVIQQIERAVQEVRADTKHLRKPEPPSQPISEEQKQRPAFKQGDRVVRIKNRVTSSIFNRRASSADKRATVTRVQLDKKGKIEKVFITTDSDLATHRLPKHLTRLE